MANDYRVVFIAHGQLEADMYRLSLEAAGIPVLTRQESAGAVYGLTVGPLGIVEVLVPGDNLLEASRLLASIEAGELEYPGESITDEDFPGGDDA